MYLFLFCNFLEKSNLSVMTLARRLEIMVIRKAL